MTSLPDLHGWLPAAALSRSLGVHPSTVRKRAKRGVYEVIPNPIGPGALYREKGGERASPTPPGPSGFVPPDKPQDGDDSTLSPREGIVWNQLPGSVSAIARTLGYSKGFVCRSLHRLEEVGAAARAETVPCGPRGGRPEIVWRVI